MSNKTFLILFVLSTINYQLSAHIPLVTEKEQLWAQAARPMDGLRVEPAKEYRTQPIIIQPVTKDGLMLLDRKVHKTGEWIDPGRERCYGPRFSRGPYPSDGSYYEDSTQCHQLPPRRVEEFTETSAYKIIDRKAYATHKEVKGGVVGGIIGGLLGGLISLAAVLPGSLSLSGYIILPLAWIGILGLMGLALGANIAKNSAYKKPDVFTETRHFTKSHPINH